MCHCEFRCYLKSLQLNMTQTKNSLSQSSSLFFVLHLVMLSGFLIFSLFIDRLVLSAILITADVMLSNQYKKRQLWGFLDQQLHRVFLDTNVSIFLKIQRVANFKDLKARVTVSTIRASTCYHSGNSKIRQNAPHPLIETTANTLMGSLTLPSTIYQRFMIHPLFLLWVASIFYLTFVSIF